MKIMKNLITATLIHPTNTIQTTRKDVISKVHNTRLLNPFLIEFDNVSSIIINLIKGRKLCGGLKI